MDLRFKLNYVVIPAATLITALTGSWLTEQGMDWYETLTLPSWTPPGALIGAVWTTIYVLATASALMVWNTAERNARLGWIMDLFIANALLNVTWSLLFFFQHEMILAAWEAAIMTLTVYVLMVLIWPISKTAALLLAPYAVWVTFATYLTYVVASLNT